MEFLRYVQISMPKGGGGAACLFRRGVGVEISTSNESLPHVWVSIQA